MFHARILITLRARISAANSPTHMYSARVIVMWIVNLTVCQRRPRLGWLLSLHYACIKWRFYDWRHRCISIKVKYGGVLVAFCTAVVLIANPETICLADAMNVFQARHFGLSCLPHIYRPHFRLGLGSISLLLYTLQIWQQIIIIIAGL